MAFQFKSFKAMIRKPYMSLVPLFPANSDLSWIPDANLSYPTQYSSAGGTVTGTINGSNATFTVAAALHDAIVVLNGATLTPTVHYTHSANTIVFLAPYIPQPGADILIEGWL